MHCEEFEAAVQAWADGVRNGPDARALDEHAAMCAACRELRFGLKLLPRALQAAALPMPSPGFSDRVVAAAVQQQQHRLFWRQTLPGRLAALAASVLVAAAAWAWSAHPRNAAQPPTIAKTPEARPSRTDSRREEPLFPEWGTADRGEDEIAIVQAAEPLATALRDLARTIGSPVRPIANATSQAVETFFNELPDTDLSMMPGMREMMPAPMKKTGMELRRSS